ncbi:MAG: cytidylate kinase, partial [Thermoprotei archaeon]
MPKNCNIVIAVSGPPGSGKTTLAQNLARALGLRYFSTGIVFRELAKKKGLSLEKLSQLAEANHSIDRYIDSQTINEARKG